MSAQWPPGAPVPEPFTRAQAEAILALVQELVPSDPSSLPLPESPEAFSGVGESLARVIDAAIGDAELRRIRFAGLDAAIEADVRAAEQAHPFRDPTDPDSPADGRP